MNRSRNIIIVLIIIVLILIIALAGIIVYMVVEKNNNSNNTIVLEESSNNNLQEENVTNNIEEDLTDETDDLAKRTFNAIFETYEGVILSGAQVKALISTIETNNAQENVEHIVNLDETGITTVEQVDTDKKYNAELSQSTEGYVNTVKITEYSEQTEGGNAVGGMEAVLFNTKFTAYLGNVTGEQLIALLQIAQQSNIENPDHQITLSSNNLQDLNSIVGTDIYVITLSYDTAGYTNNINIDKKV